MLKNIQTAPRPAAPEDCFTMLMSCHGHIREFSALAVRLAEAEGTTAEQVASAAERVHRYFTVALPLHEADENVSIDPRVQQMLTGSDVAQASAEMVEQHRGINQVLRRLIPLWERLIADPARLAEARTELLRDSRELSELFDKHLRLEEEVIFPAMRRQIGCAVLETIRGEMKARRTDQVR